MDLQHQAANAFVEALVARHMGTAMATRADGYLVSIREHPQASVHFTYGPLRELVVKFVLDGRPPRYLDYLPTRAGAEQAADFVVQQIAGEGGRGANPAPS